MKLSASLLLAAKSARAGITHPNGCCSHVTIDADSNLANLDNSRYYEYAGKNKAGKHYYQSVTECGAEQTSNR